PDGGTGAADGRVGVAETAIGSAGRAGAAGALAGDGAACIGAPAPPITATTVFTCTVVPSFTLISRSTPLARAGISASTLSLELSNSGSSRWILSPGFFSHLVMVPSKMDSPICGMTTSVGMEVRKSVAQCTAVLAGGCRRVALEGDGAGGVETPVACGTDFAGAGAVFECRCG